ncbi:helix-turn-helix domain-containing protein [Diaphorobacter caeni]|uniref:helix-turn-helix domain-containing protein n=1 Tax=Diaphorobacter caeni TaxID=2784387 RepID=UPI00188EC97D|nr:helix-turn-helix domain-containing protein [Diaphorobacter caeni]MBF5007617.1 helix-turn-helix domain-containing protein [Diaphorobacter caeni]
MSIKLMTAVFERYPNGGGEMLLALALADHASDDGTRVYPSIKALAEKTRQSERTIQYQLRRMQEAGWLILVNTGNGGRSMTSEYRISSDWIKGAEIAPIQKGATDDKKGATDDIKGCNPQQKRVQRVAPANNRQEPSKNHQGTEAQALGLDEVDDQLLDDWNKVRAAKRVGNATSAAVKGLKREAAKAGLTDAEAIEVCCANGWQGFRAEWYARDTMPTAMRPSRRSTAEHKYAAAAAAIYDGVFDE